jgi:hypothetical protein
METLPRGAGFQVIIFALPESAQTAVPKSGRTGVESRKLRPSGSPRFQHPFPVFLREGVGEEEVRPGKSCAL